VEQAVLGQHVAGSGSNPLAGCNEGQSSCKQSSDDDPSRGKEQYVMSEVSINVKELKGERTQDQDREPSRVQGWGKSKDELIRLEIKQSM
jgi:hypothetical protein